MKRPNRKALVPLKVEKAVCLPKHSLSDRLGKVLKAIDTVQFPKNLKIMHVVMDSQVQGGEFIFYANRGPYEIRINPNGSHPELSLLHEVGHYLEWQSIPKIQNTYREFQMDPLFKAWNEAVYASPTRKHLSKVLENHQEGTQASIDIGYFLRTDELWTRSYSQYIARKTEMSVLFQQIAAENKVVTGNIRYKPYWSWEEFSPIENAMDVIFAEAGWSKSVTPA